MRIPVPLAKPTFHTPMRFDWTDEKLQTLSQKQLLNLLDNLDHQLAIGRIPQDVASALEPRIVASDTATARYDVRFCVLGGIASVRGLNTARRALRYSDVSRDTIVRPWCWAVAATIRSGCEKV